MSANGKTVLLVDDDTSSLETLGEILRGAGYNVVCARNGAEALACLQVAHPDVVMLDYVMPQMDGATTLGALKHVPDLGNVAIIMTSGLPEEVVRARCSDYDAFLQKPIDVDRALRTLSALCALTAS